MQKLSPLARLSVLLGVVLATSCVEAPAEPGAVAETVGAQPRSRMWVGYATTGPLRKGWILGADGEPQQVTFEVHNGNAIWNGDIDLGPAEHIPLTRDALLRLPAGARFSMILNRSDRRWRYGEVPYEISATLPDSGRVFSAIATLVRETNGVVLVPRTDEEDYVRFVPSTGCSSRIGRVGGRQDINLAPDCDAGSVQHEIMHALGYLHEHQRCDRRFFIDILFENVESGKESNFESRCESGDNSGVDFGQYDESSIMHYGINAFSKNGQPTIQSLRGLNHLMGSRVISEGDEAAVEVIYGAFNDAPTLVFDVPQEIPMEGAIVKFNAGASFDPDDPELRFIWNFGDGTCDGAPPKPAQCSQSNPWHTYAKSGKYTGRVAVTDGHALAREAFVIAVENAPPTGELTGPARVSEGSSAYFTLFVDDAGRDDVTIEIDPGTGASAISSFMALSSVNFDNPGSRIQFHEIRFPRSGSFVVTAHLTDSDGGRSVVRLPVHVENSAPTTSIAALAPQYTSGETISFAMLIDDNGSFDGPWSYRWDVGFQSPVSGSSAMLGRIAVPLPACKPGTWHTTLTVSDNEGASSSATRSVVVAPFAVSVDVLPGNSPNSISLARAGRLSVAIYGTAALNARDLDASSMTLGDGAGTETSVDRRKDGAPFATLEDVNVDGILDLQLLFDLAELQKNGDVSSATTRLTVRGRKRDGCTHVEGGDAVRIVR